MTDHTYAGYTAEQIRAAAESGLWSQFINVARPETVLSLLDRIAELEQRANAAEGWHLIETGRADELQANVNLNRDEIAGLRARIAELEPDAARWSAIISGDLEGLTLFAHNADWTTLDPLVGSTADAALDDAMAQPAE